MRAYFFNPVSMSERTAPNIANETLSHISILATVKCKIGILVEQIF